MAPTTSLVGLSPVLLARLLGLTLSGVVSVLVICLEGVAAWSNIALRPLVLSPLVLRPKFWEKAGHPWWWYSPGPCCQAAGGVCCRKGVGGLIPVEVRSMDKVAAGAVAVVA